jgi:hypothetical protein
MARSPARQDAVARRGAARALLAAAAAALAAGCGTDVIPSEVLRGTAVVTYFDPSVDYGTFRTYALVNKLVVEQETSGSIGYEFVPAPEILGAIQANLALRGYVKVAEVDPDAPPPTPPDADLAVVAIALQATRYAVYPCGWWDWWGYPGYGCDYPWTWIAYRTGTLDVQLFDTRGLAAGTPPPAVPMVWSGVGYAVLTPSTASNVQIAVNAVNQMFEQSPYLVTP